MEKGKIIDYLTFALAVIGIIESFRQLIMGNLNPTQAASAAVVFAAISQIGSIIRIVIQNNEDKPVELEEAA